MIRFCDNELCCVLESELDRSAILNYFFQNHMDDIVCVLNEEEQYVGKITYYSLINTNDVYEAVQKDSVTLNSEIWKNARYYFSHYRSGLNEHVLLPVVNKDRRLISFAYEDFDANREIRMLRELSENADALQFRDIYPEYQGVKIYEFNELAYFFAEYLKKQNIAVQVYGGLWNGFVDSAEIRLLEYNYLSIYAEGIQPKKADWLDNLLESVSVEFECIDHIYEMNIKNHIILDAEGSIEELVHCLKDKREIVIIGSGREAQDVYDYLAGNDIDISCFVDENYEECSHLLFGKPILRSLDARNKYKDAVFIECMSEHSAWGVGGTDIYDYLGYRRNKEFYLIKDYVEIDGKSLIHVLDHKKVALLGDVNLCNYLCEVFLKAHSSIVSHAIEMCHYYQQDTITEIEVNAIDEETICLIVLHEFFDAEQKQRQIELKRRITKYLKDKGHYNYTDYFSYTKAFLDIEQYQIDKYSQKFMLPKKIILGSIENSCGNVFFKGLLDGHPSVLMIDYCELNDNLFWICICLSKLKAKHILNNFWKIYREQMKWKGISNPEVFNSKMQELLAQKDQFTSQELFVIFHISYMYMNGHYIPSDSIKNLVIYWEPHHIERSIVEEFVKWLATKNMGCDIINVVRNIVMRYGVIRSYFLQENKDKSKAYFFVMKSASLYKKDYEWSERVIVKFEDLKSSPKKTLKKICSNWGITWSDSLMMTTRNGKKEFFYNGVAQISDFDLQPVHNLNETYFSEFDRLRIMIINSPWQRKYGYPYVEISQFTRRELWNMFSKKFRFEELGDKMSTKLEREFRIRLNAFVRDTLQNVRMIESKW